jgi:cation transport protein ChaC
MSKNGLPAKAKLLKALEQMRGMEPTSAVLDMEPLRTIFSHYLDLVGAGPFAVFGYGSLMWKPEFEPEFRERAKVYGYARQPCIKSTTYRGTPEKPGLVFGLDQGGSCVGIAQGLPVKRRAEILGNVFVRECFQGVYWPQVLTAHSIDSDKKIPCLTFVANRVSSAYAPPLPKKALRDIVLTARGKSGRCVDYWNETERHCQEVGIDWKHGLEFDS